MVGKLSDRNIQIYLREIITAVGFLHSEGWMYLDLKIENLMLDRHQAWAVACGEKRILKIDIYVTKPYKINLNISQVGLTQLLCPPSSKPWIYFLILAQLLNCSKPNTDRHGRIKLIDFEFATNDEKSDLFVGSIVCMAPEVCLCMMPWFFEKKFFPEKYCL